jgi:hypothetical protein
MGARSTDRSPKGFGINKVLDGKLLEFFNTKRTGGGIYISCFHDIFNSGF